MHDVLDEIFGKIHVVVEIEVGHLWLHHPELCEVATCLRLFRAEGWTKRVHLTKRHGTCFGIELSGLREIRLAKIEVLCLEQRRRTFTRVWREDRRVHQAESIAIEEIADRLDHGCAHAHDRMLTCRPQPQVAMCHQEFYTVFLWRNRIVLRGLPHTDVGYVELDACWRAIFLAHCACDRHR